MRLCDSASCLGSSQSLVTTLKPKRTFFTREAKVRTEGWMDRWVHTQPPADLRMSSLAPGLDPARWSHKPPMAAALGTALLTPVQLEAAAAADSAGPVRPPTSQAHSVRFTVTIAVGHPPGVVGDASRPPKQRPGDGLAVELVGVGGAYDILRSV